MTTTGDLTPRTEDQATAATLPTVRANGFTVLSDVGAAGPEGDLRLLSLIGRKPAVEAVSAACLPGRGAVMYPSPRQPGFAAHAPLTGEVCQTLSVLLAQLDAQAAIARVAIPPKQPAPQQDGATPTRRRGARRAATDQDMAQS